MSAPTVRPAPPCGNTDGAWPSPRAAYRPRAWHALVAAAILLLVLLDVRFDGLLRQFDATSSDWLLSWGMQDHGFLNAFGWVLSQTGGRGPNLVLILVMCGVIFAQRRTYAPFVQVLSASALMYLTVYPIKAWLDRSFPTDPGGDYLHASPAPGGAFPSGHQVNATVLVGVGAWIAMEYIANDTVRRVIAIYAVVAPIVCAIAVLIMGYHWVSDVIGGTCAGIILLWFVRWFWASPLGERATAAMSVPRRSPRAER
ncbi:phosphatase PAP2 family protein [Cumulibacter soli]|uniref:phosphatase PAP2 family protein n=1 Tax=Cumulibacter soli TaxID=2546344 RepID=UPI00106858B1|nr:phosphatase PAP2 family protein [Cumulibacter soli]